MRIFAKKKIERFLAIKKSQGIKTVLQQRLRDFMPNKNKNRKKPEWFSGFRDIFGINFKNTVSRETCLKFQVYV